MSDHSVCAMEVSKWQHAAIEAQNERDALAAELAIVREQYASYREAAGASIGADLNQQAIERIARLEAVLRSAQTDPGNWLHAELSDEIERLVGPAGDYHSIDDSGLAAETGTEHICPTCGEKFRGADDRF